MAYPRQSQTNLARRGFPHLRGCAVLVGFLLILVGCGEEPIDPNERARRAAEYQAQMRKELQEHANAMAEAMQDVADLRHEIDQRVRAAVAKQVADELGFDIAMVEAVLDLADKKEHERELKIVWEDCNTINTNGPMSFQKVIWTGADNEDELIARRELIVIKEGGE